MKVAAITTCKNEHDIIEDFVAHTLGQVDFMVVSDNGSTDGTRDKLAALEAEHAALTVVDDPEVAWYQSRKMSALAELAATMGAEWIVPADVDELWFSHVDRVADILPKVPDNILLCQAPLFDHVAVPTNGRPMVDMAWREAQPLPLRKVACRYRKGLALEAGNHGAGYPRVPVAPTALDLLVIHHFPYRSPEQFITKVVDGARGYAAADVPPSLGVHKRDWGALYDREGDAALRAVFAKRFYNPNPAQDPDLVHDPCLR